MAKKIKIMEACVITKDDKGQLTLVGKAKEALTTFAKNKIDVTICLESDNKEAVESFLKDNNVPYKTLASVPDGSPSGKEKFDAVIVPDGNIVILRDDWTWAMNNIVDKLYDNQQKPPQKSEQEKMDERFKDYKRWADQANEAHKKKKSESVDVIG